MLKQLIAQSLNGFGLTDFPFLILQLSTSAVLVFLVRIFWRKGVLDSSEMTFLDYLIPVQLVLTSLAIFGIKTPWLSILFGILALIPLLGGQSFSLRSRAFYLISVFIALGCGSTNLVVTSIITLFLILPCLYFYKPK